ncbi:threonine-phosphate decarboxylase [Rhizobium rhizosphaerae]|uniref:threonine-phosphate decarboxylase n=1 Tax=Xaviernesmea rhizosphaerae TaxID=1672749 RepID=A0ABX3PK51_9HYPH|nr:threonine-phosphate decarboxylase CobD [Xaviernesmea rhizosphaerae]OQP88503.1 threonine-phosphate decarboxylase [Xaviernesmea rhizosphaerae]
MPPPILHGGGLTAAMRHYGGRRGDWLDLSTGLNPCPPGLPPISPEAWHRLPDESAVLEARHAARDFYGTGALLPLPVAGTQAAIQSLPALLPALLAGSGRVAILAPTYGEYRRVFQAAGHAVDLVTDLDMIGAEHRLVIIVNPNNPTGRLLPAATLLALADRLSAQGGVLVVDEAFADVAPQESLAGHAGHRPGLIVLRSLGKVFGFAGIRLGFVLAEPALLLRLDHLLGPWSVSGPALVVGAALMRGDAEAIRARILRRSQGLDMALSAAKVRHLGGTPLFRLIEVPDARLVHERLARLHILTRRFEEQPTWLRIGLAPSAQADLRFGTALCDALAAPGPVPASAEESAY